MTNRFALVVNSGRVGMLRRPPTRIELNEDDAAELTRSRNKKDTTMALSSQSEGSRAQAVEDRIGLTQQRRREALRGDISVLKSGIHSAQ